MGQKSKRDDEGEGTATCHAEWFSHTSACPACYSPLNTHLTLHSPRSPSCCIKSCIAVTSPCETLLLFEMLPLTQHKALAWVPATLTPRSVLLYRALLKEVKQHFHSLTDSTNTSIHSGTLDFLFHEESTSSSFPHSPNTHLTSI